MRSTTARLALVAAVTAMVATNAVAQTTTAPPRPVTPGATPGATSVTPTPGTTPSTGVTPGTSIPGSGIVDRNAGAAAASGDSNQAVATTNANAPHPARGANSYSQGQARTRIADHGFQNVSGLHKDDGGVWRGTATKDGQQVGVWLDYKGNVGQE